MPDDKHLPIIDPVMISEKIDIQKPRLIIVGSHGEDNRIIKCLSHNIYELHEANTIQELYDLLSEGSFDLIILDVKVPDTDSISLIQMLFAKSDSFRLLVRSETDDEVDTVLALELGADDCIALSCSLREVRARVRALLRRRIDFDKRLIEESSQRRTTLGSKISHEGWVLDRDRCILLSPRGNVIDLTNSEYGILVNLFSNPGLAKDRSSLLNIDSESSEYDIRSLDVFISRIRKKMALYNGQDLIETVRGRGYRLSTTTSRIE